MKQARSVPESGVFADVQCFYGHRRPSVLCGETTQGHSHLKLLQPPHIGCEFNRWHDCRMDVQANAFETTNKEAAGRHESKPSSTHTQVRSLGQARRLHRVHG